MLVLPSMQMTKWRPIGSNRDRKKVKEEKRMKRIYTDRPVHMLLWLGRGLGSFDYVSACMCVASRADVQFRSCQATLMRRHSGASS